MIRAYGRSASSSRLASGSVVDVVGSAERNGLPLVAEAVASGHLHEPLVLGRLHELVQKVLSVFLAHCRAIATRSRSSGVIRWSASFASSPRSICTQLTVPVKTLLSPS